VFGGVLSGGFPENKALEQGVASEAICAVQAGAGNFAAGVEVWDIGLCVEVCFDASDHIVCAGSDGDEVFGDVDVEASAQFVDEGETVGELFFVEVSDIEVNVGGGGFEHLREDGTADDVAWCQFGVVVVVGHKAVVVNVEQLCAFASDSFGDQCAGGAGDVEGGGVKLDEFEVLKDGSCAVCHSQSVCGSDGGIGGFSIKHSCAAGGEDGVCSPDDLYFAAVATDDSEAVAVLVGEQIDAVEVFEDFYIGDLFDFFDECFGDDSSCFVAVCVCDARMAVTAFEGGGDASVVQVEVGSPLQQFSDEVRSLADDPVDNVFVAYSTTGPEGVVDVSLEGVCFVEDGGDAALGFPGIAVFEAVFAEQQDVTVPGGFDGGAEAGDSGSDDEAIGESLVGGDGVDIDEVSSEIGRIGHFPFPDFWLSFRTDCVAMPDSPGVGTIIA